MSQEILHKHHFLPREVITFIIITILSGICLFNFVSLEPTVDNNFFFSSEDPQFQSEHLINSLFIRKDSQLIISATGNINGTGYHEKISELSKRLLEIDGVTNVNSLTHAGPGDVKAAFKSPLWKRLIVASNRKSTNLIVLLDENKVSLIIPEIEETMGIFEDEGFHLQAAGLPYVVELIRRNLQKDFRIFSLLAFLIFGFLIFQIFRSKSILLGTMLSCLNAVMWTFKITDLIGIPMGILTANLGTIIFVMTLSHIIFLTFNWRIFRSDPNSKNPVADAIARTLPPSIWSMLTTLLGFLSLMSVSAKPLRELGHSGALGSIVAIVVAYGVFPTFLRVASQQSEKKGKIENYGIKTYKFINLEKQFIMLIIFVTCLLTLPGLKRLDSDPSLLSYFSKSSEIHKGLSYIDQNGGSSPLILVVGTKSKEKIHSDKSYKQLWNLQESLEQHRGVGSVISLPVLIAQAAKTPIFGWLFPRSILLKAMEMPTNDKIAKSFITKDRKYGLFYLRMIESYRVLPRLDVVEEIKSIAENEGFHTEIIGGIYNLQGHLAKLVASSLVGGLGKLILLFALITWFISRSLRMTLAVVASISIIPLTILGCFGVYRIPLDIISAPASNVAIAMGIDSMIHMIKSFRRTRNWQTVRDELWQPILTSMFVVAAGFGIFLLSSFPPTQRFGGAILFGTVLAALTALYIMPLLFEYISLDKWRSLLKKKPKTTTST
ncbi:MAG: MMPL family transporter [Candidatus Omnitrophica bacterium]|nr:MMPL family transporter [Candidatus Omnitrophota bacterium]